MSFGLCLENILQIVNLKRVKNCTHFIEKETCKKMMFDMEIKNQNTRALTV